jgi:predicted secreted Zn-dependent protease
MRLRLLLPLLVALLLAGAIACGAARAFSERPPVSHPSPGLTVKAHYRYYPISGRTAAELRAQMDRLGPLDSYGDRYDALTSWWISWRFRYGASGSRCRIAGVSAQVKLAFVFPRWQKPAGARAALVRKWRRYLDALNLHEQGHASNALGAARRIMSAIRSLGPESSCDILGGHANDIGHHEVALANAADLAYDKKTDHGASQGARFP